MHSIVMIQAYRKWRFGTVRAECNLNALKNNSKQTVRTVSHSDAYKCRLIFVERLRATLGLQGLIQISFEQIGPTNAVYAVCDVVQYSDQFSRKAGSMIAASLLQ